MSGARLRGREAPPPRLWNFFVALAPPQQSVSLSPFLRRIGVVCPISGRNRRIPVWFPPDLIDLLVLSGALRQIGICGDGAGLGLDCGGDVQIYT